MENKKISISSGWNAEVINDAICICYGGTQIQIQGDNVKIFYPQNADIETNSKAGKIDITFKG